MECIRERRHKICLCGASALQEAAEDHLRVTPIRSGRRRYRRKRLIYSSFREMVYTLTGESVVYGVNPGGTTTL